MTGKGDLVRLTMPLASSPGASPARSERVSPTERAFIVKSIFGRWLPTIALTSTRKAVLGLAGVVLAGAAVVGATHGATTVNAAPAATTGVVASATVASDPTQVAVKPAAPVAPPAPAKPAAAPPAPAKPAAPPAPAKEKALGYDFALQPNYYYCGPAATRIALTALGQWHTFDELAGEMGTTEDGTDSAFDIARALNANLGGNVYHTVEIPGQSATKEQIDKLRWDVVAAITSNHPIVANVAGAAIDLHGGQHYYPGHYVAIVGYGEHGTTVKIADPADIDANGSYWMSTVDAANWMGTHGYAVN
jgi:hypothetical protein